MELKNVGIETNSEEESLKIVNWFKSKGVSCSWSGNASSGVYFVGEDNIVDIVSGLEDLPKNIKLITMEKVLPANYIVKTTTAKETTKVLHSIQKEKGEYSHWDYVTFVNGAPNIFYELPTSGYYKDIPVLTFSEWEKLTSGNIIGYKAPTDLFKGAVKAGTIYKIDNYHSNEKYNTCSCDEDAYHNMPKEVVETWEPVYEEIEEVLTVGSNSLAIKISKGNIHCEKLGGEVLIDDLNRLVQGLKPKVIFHGYTVEIDQNLRCIRIGCKAENHLFSLEEINNIINIYNKLNG